MPTLIAAPQSGADTLGSNRKTIECVFRIRKITKAWSHALTARRLILTVCHLFFELITSAVSVLITLS